MAGAGCLSDTDHAMHLDEMHLTFSWRGDCVDPLHDASIARAEWGGKARNTVWNAPLMAPFGA